MATERMTSSTWLILRVYSAGLSAITGAHDVLGQGLYGDESVAQLLQAPPGRVGRLAVLGKSGIASNFVNRLALLGHCGRGHLDVAVLLLQERHGLRCSSERALGEGP